MRLLSLEINNFRVIKSATIEFPDKVIAIVGKNGTGKSSIIEAISWALYGNQAARSGKDEIKSTFADESENCEVRVKFLINEEQFTVIRRLIGRTNRAEVELFRGDKSESVGVNETKSHVGQLLGLDWRGYLSSFLARQSELNALSDLVPSKRKDHIAGMLGIERLDKAMQTLKQDTKLYKEKTAFLERALSERESIDVAIADLLVKLQSIELEIKPQKLLFESSQKEFTESKQKYEEYIEKKNQFIKTESELLAQKSTFELLSEQVSESQKEKIQLLKQQDQLKELQEKQDSLKEIPNKLEQLKKQKSNKKFLDELNSQEKVLTIKIEQNNQLIVELNGKQKKLEQQYNSLPKDIEITLENQKMLLEDKRSQYSSLKTEIARFKIDIDKLVLQKSNISTLKSESVCDRCHRPLGDDFESIQKHIEDEISQLESDQIAKTKNQNTILQDGEQLKISCQLLEKQLKEQTDLKREIESIQKELKQSTTLSNEFLTQKKDVLGKLAKIGDIQFDEKEFEELSNQFALYEENRNSINRYQGQLERLPILNDEIIKLEQKISSTKVLIEEIAKRLKLIDYDDLRFKKRTEQYNNSQHIYEESKNRYFEINKTKEITTVSLKEKQIQLDQFKKSELEFEESKSSHYYGEKLSSLFTQYRHELIASIRPTLADLSSRLFNEMTGNKYNLVELDEKYDLRVMDNGQFYGVERFSGGEKDLANLCLRLAISLSLTESAGLTRSFIILDEVFGSQDNSRKDLILSALANLKNRFPQIILITHIEDIKDGVEQIIEVKQNEYGHSEVIVHGS